MEKKLVVKHEHCIHCGVCMMRGYCITKEGQKYIKADLPKEKWSEAEMNCPVGAIQQVEEAERENRFYSSSFPPINEKNKLF